jgi:hypothetical protein
MSMVVSMVIPGWSVDEQLCTCEVAGRGCYRMSLYEVSCGHLRLWEAALQSCLVLS